MGFFTRKNNKILDLSENYKREQKKVQVIKEEPLQKTSTDSGSSNMFSFFAGASQNTQTSQNSQEEYPDLSGENDKKRKLAKRLLDMTTKIEEISNQIYKIQQRLELLERKNNIN